MPRQYQHDVDPWSGRDAEITLTSRPLDDGRTLELDHLTEAVARLLGVPMVLVSTVEGGEQCFLGAFGLAPSLQAARKTHAVHPYCQRVLDTGRPLIVHDTRRRTLSERDLLGAVGYAGFPLTVAGEDAPLAVLAAIDHAARRWSARDIAALRAVAALCSSLLERRGARQEVVALEAALVHARAECERWQSAARLAVHDELTGLLTRRGFHAVAEGQLALARRRHMPGLMLFLDLDGLKEINDRAGHAAGDTLLRAAADVLRATFRDADTIGRLGGDELGVFSVDAAPPSLDAITTRLAAEVARINVARDPAMPLTWSLGAVTFDAGAARNLHHLIAEADRRMYEAKRRRQQERL